MNPSNYYQKGLLKLLVAEGILDKYKNTLEALKIHVNSKEKNLYDLANNLKQNEGNVINLLKEVEGNSQDAEMAKNIMPTVNYIMHTLQSFIVSGKKTVNTISRAILSTETDWQFDFSDAEKLELIRQRLISDTISVSDVAKLFEIKDGALELKPEIKFDGFEKEFNAIKAAIKKEVGNDNNNLRALQEGKNNWYDFECLNTIEYQKAVEIFKSVMKYLTETLISAISMVKDIANYAHTFRRQDGNLFDKNSAELVSDLNRNRGKNPLAWAEIVQLAKAQEPIVQV